VSFVGGEPVTDPDDPCQVDYRALAIEHSGIDGKTTDPRPGPKVG